MISFLREQAPDQASAYEKQAFEQLVDSLKDSAENSSLLIFEPDEFASAIRLLLGEAVAEEDKDSPEGRISSLEDLDRLHGFAPLSIHVADLSAKWVPSSESPVPWPLTKSLLDSAAGAAALQAKRLVTQLEARAEADLFLFYGALAISPDIILSWSHQLNGEESVRSPFLKLLDLKPSPAASAVLVSTLVPSAPVRTVHEPFRPDDFPIDAAFIHSICPRRYVYDFVVHDGPFYESGFAQGFAISSYLHLRSRVRPERRFGPTPWRQEEANPDGNCDQAVVAEFRRDYTSIGNHAVWSEASLGRGVKAGRSVSKGYLQYPLWLTDYRAAAQRYERSLLRLLLLPSAHDTAWTAWRRRIGFEGLYTSPEKFDAAFSAPPDSTASDQRMSEFLNAYWEWRNNHRHEAGRLHKYVNSDAGLEAANQHQSEMVSKRRAEFRDHLATPGKLHEVVPEAHPGGWCQKCPHAGYCGAVKRRGEEVGEG
jgi:hypothetical protein